MPRPSRSLLVSRYSFFPQTEFDIQEEIKTEEQMKYEQEIKKDVEALQHPYLVALEYCGWLPEETKAEKKIKREIQSFKPYCCFNHQMGMPKKVYEDPVTKELIESEPLELYEYERRCVMNYESHKYYGLNKIRGAGISEVLAVRHMTYKYGVENRFVGRKYLLAAGINREVAVGMFKRILELVKPYTLIIFSDIPNYTTPIFLKFRGGGEGHALSAKPNAPRSLDKVGDVLLDEAAHWDLTEDETVLKAYEPFVAKSVSHIGVFSTPGGQRGLFWTKLFNPEVKSKYFLDVITLKDVTDVPIPIIDTEEAENLKRDDPDLYAQEFGNAFILPSTSVFGDKFEKNEEEAEF